ncbi:MAG: hypothetical protein LBR22_00880, partial [Desulfovibrio sp.]|nr:hypothetical protein [Desulfovibrio sp.]
MAHDGEMKRVLERVREAHAGQGREFAVHTLTAVLRLRPEPGQVEPLRRTLAAFRTACNFAVDVLCGMHSPAIAEGKYGENLIPGENARQKACRDEIRLRFLLPGQMANDAVNIAREKYVEAWNRAVENRIPAHAKKLASFWRNAAALE